jgi:phage-related baseplate assembly protein
MFRGTARGDQLPGSDLQIDNTQVARNTGYNVENGGTDE